MANHDMEPDSEPDYDATNDDGLDDPQCLTYGDIQKRTAANQAEAESQEWMWTRSTQSV